MLSFFCFSFCNSTRLCSNAKVIRHNLSFSSSKCPSRSYNCSFSFRNAYLQYRLLNSSSTFSSSFNLSLTYNPLHFVSSLKISRSSCPVCSRDGSVYNHRNAMWEHILPGKSKEGIVILSHILVLSFVELFIRHPMQYCKTRNDVVCQLPFNLIFSSQLCFREWWTHQFLFDFYFGRSEDFLDGVEFSDVASRRSHVASAASHVSFWVHSGNHSS
jgi:hypothetical protein